MDDIVAALAQQQSELAGVLDATDWSAPSRCEGWTVADVVLHLAQSNEMAVASLEGRYGEHLAALLADAPAASSVDDAVDAFVRLERGRPTSELRERWRASAERQQSLLEQSAPRRRVAWVSGQMSVHTLAATRLAETWIHTGDVAGRWPATAGLEHVSRLAWRTLPYALAGGGHAPAGPVAFELDGPGGERWSFAAEEAPVTTIRGSALDLCLVAGRRADPAATGLTGEGPDAEAVLALVRTYA